MASGPHTGWERALLIWVLPTVLISCLSYIFVFAENSLDTREKFLAFFIRPKVVESDVTRMALEASEFVLETNKELSRIEKRGKEIFGRSHTWQIPNFTPGETIQALTESERLMHPDFVTELSRRSAILGEKEGQIIFDYGHFRKFYSESILIAKDYNEQCKRRIRSVNASPLRDHEIDTKELARQVSELHQDVMAQSENFEAVIQPFFSQP